MKITDLLFIVPNNVGYQELFLYLIRNGFNPFWMPEINTFKSFMANSDDLKIMIIDQEISPDFTIIQKIKFSQKTSECGIIFLANDEGSASKARFLGADYVLVKPVIPEKLHFSIKEVMSMHNYFNETFEPASNLLENVNPSILSHFDKIKDYCLKFSNIRVIVLEVLDAKDKINLVTEEIMKALNGFLENQIPFKGRFILFPFTANDIALIVFYPDTFSKNLFMELTKEIEDEITPILERYKATYNYGFSDSSNIKTESLETIIYTLLKKAYEVIWDTRGNKFSKYTKEFDRIIRNKQIWTEYQPIVDLENYSIWGYEALSRGPSNTIWQAPEFLFEMAFKFDRVHELEMICLGNSISHFKYLNFTPRLFINIHPLAVEHIMLNIDKIKDKLSDFEIVIEITEKKFIQDFVRFQELFKILKSHGLKIALDDVGSGYSSLQYLIELDVDYIKIDRSLVNNLGQNFIKESVVSALVQISQNLRAKVIAEGIENRKDLAVLKNLGINYGQGYLFAYPSITPIVSIDYNDKTGN